MNRILCAAAALIAFTLPASAKTILFVGNSFTLGPVSPVASSIKPDSVHDLNPPNDRGQTLGGVPALFKEFTKEAGPRLRRELETVGGKGFDFHYRREARVAGQALGRGGDARLLHPRQGQSRRSAAADFVFGQADGPTCSSAKNPNVKVWFSATWSRADQT